jgi:hypothetical protein
VDRPRWCCGSRGRWCHYRRRLLFTPLSSISAATTPITPFATTYTSTTNPTFLSITTIASSGSATPVTTPTPMTRPPAQAGSAGAVDTALATPGCGYAAYLRHFMIYTYCTFGHQGPRANHKGTAPLTTERRTRSGSVPSVRFLCVGQTSTSFSAFAFSSHYCDSPARLSTSPVHRQPHSTP